MIALGRHMAFMGSLSASDFGDLVRESWAQAVGARISFLERSLSLYDEQPSYWADDIYEYMDGLKQSLKKTDRPVLEEGREAGPQSEHPKFLRQLIMQFGELLVLWPDIWTRARSRREEMGSFAKRV